MERCRPARWLRRSGAAKRIARILMVGATWSALANARAAPLDVTPGLDGMVERYLTAIAHQQLAARAVRVAALHAPAEIEARQQYIRARLLEEIGGLPEKTPLNARVAGTLERGEYRVEKLIFESLPHYYVTANVYVPTTARPPYPAVLGAAGHLAAGKAAEPYQRVWVSLAKRGFLVLAYDPPGQGERVQYLDPATGKSRLGENGVAEHTMAGSPCLLTGTNIARYFIWDGVRALDYLLTRPDVDPRRVGVAGNSGGGTLTCYLAALEPRFAAAAPSCYLTSWEKLWDGPGPQDPEQVFVNFLADGFDFPDFLAAFAPKPVQLAVATKDFFPIAGARATFAEAQRIFDLLGARDRIGWFEFDDPHGWSRPRREATYRWLAQWLQNRADAGAEPDFTVEPPPALQCTPTGQVATSCPGAETVQSLNAALAERIYAQRAAAQGGNLPALVRARLGVPAARGAPSVVTCGAIERAGYRIEKLELQPEAGIVVPALAFVPAGGPERKPAVLYLQPAGKAADAGAGGAIEALVQAGNLVLAIDPRGCGESRPRGPDRGGYGPAYQAAMRALLVGRNLPGMQTGDVLWAFDYLWSRPDVDSARIRLVGRGNGGVIALFAALLEPRVARVSTTGAPASYLELVRAKTHESLLEIAVPGVLRDFDLPDIKQALGARLDKS